MKSIIKGRDPVSQLYRAVDRYVKANGGTVVAIGGIQMQEWGDSEYTYSIAVKCTGKKPSFSGGAKAAAALESK